MVHWFGVHGYPLAITASEASICWYDDGEPVVSLSFPLEKPPAFLTIDDRALLFTGTWPDVGKLKAFKPWNKE
jgi:hypothetical protein